jgi:hypothetical protein
MGHLAIKFLASRTRKLLPGTRKVLHLLLHLIGSDVAAGLRRLSVLPGKHRLILLRLI